MNLTFRQLRVFTEVVRHGSMARAAESLHLTAPAVSMQIKELEGQVGLPLFDRQGRQVNLSTAGEYFLVHAKRLLAALRDAENEMARMKKLEGGRLTIGMVSTAQYFVPRLLAMFRKEHPGVDVRLVVAANRAALVSLMQAGEVDLSVMGRPPKELATRSEAFAAHPMVFFCAPGHPLLSVDHSPVTALAPYPFIVREHGSGTRAAMGQFFAEHHFEPQITMEMTSNETIKQAVMAGMGLSFLSMRTVRHELAAGHMALLDISGMPIVGKWYVTHLSQKKLSPAAQSFKKFLVEQAEPLIDSWA